ncbi:urease accessory protein UreD [Phyllobacterium endophyticum]|uniref:Urease accessory protein UreD n=1 Tax=Phyllobacterium endophyticum TaxID=1149773 RepID=A0A2P7B0Z5_9HYPH|nr:urease accessory protein UreD [Phyllobacterium endophyticum]MBB3237689.1 urease accessory protein [Phyllobacterium endophyticum]PSH60148.1 urease accessory protein [Phyllobacterium endophyticum]TXR48603.1 urease accessory protein UreD [Phyllobacterium endophyticum]TYR42314.1 urease accessory protein UreD [Phyllobacterium endophyticum]
MIVHPSPDPGTEARPQRAFGAAHLAVKPVDGRTRIGTLYQEGCAKILLPITDDDSLEAVMVNTSGGLTGGDEMHWKFDTADDCKAQVTTQACERIYKSSGGVADVASTIRIGERSSLAWLPQETILFEGSALKRTLTVELAATSRALIVEPIVFGRKAMGEDIQNCSFRDRWRIHRDGKLIHAEDFAIGPQSAAMLERPALLGGMRTMATLLLVDSSAERHLEASRKIIGTKGGVSFWSGKLLARLIDGDAYSLRKRLVPLIELLNETAGVPKVWSI